MSRKPPERKKRYEEIELPVSRQKFKPLTANQEMYVEEIRRRRIVICTGVTGTGKSHVAIAMALQMLNEGKINKIILCRPLVVCDNENLGFLPGTVTEKLQPFLFPLFDLMLEYISLKDLNNYLENDIVELLPLAFVRGRNFKNSFVILDEAQNATYTQLLAFLTRISTNSKLIVDGDFKQSDRKGGKNPLEKIVAKLKGKSEDIGIVEMTHSDIVRDELVRLIVELLQE